MRERWCIEQVAVLNGVMFTLATNGPADSESTVFTGILDLVKPETVTVTRPDGTSNRFVIEEERNDGAIVLRPDTSFEAIMERAPGRAMTSEEFERLIAPRAAPARLTPTPTACGPDCATPAPART